MKTGNRVGLVLGAGGTLGAAWMIGGLAAVEERIGRPLHTERLDEVYVLAPMASYRTDRPWRPAGGPSG